ncbi:RNA polymerase, sigma 54 subunit, RpoN/SigL [Mariprofundus ferrinatatus]|uniref:RNA polymerase sigma-54 factor n=1 Tax=Mariprofundus ferrinatatus TaxID=1921087 RepID=A0A2K8L109_9PROT|nr:RNA polymerase factor sigma-54 [Mariprofundus ferrinatatus]ATX81000.1 RNA polymerase, sigma 54 subunit, RpoN/SigL [Mariprofundus ferrinatatus]
MDTRLTHKLGQRLSLTPQLTQSLKVLAMNSIELEHYLEESVESNPLLEVDQESFTPDEAGAQQRALEMDEQEQWKEQGDNRWETMYSSSTRDDMPDREQMWQDELSLGDSLHEQVDREPMDDVDREIAHVIIDSLDDDGYFRNDPAEFAEEMSELPGIDGERVEKVLVEVVHQLEPAGLGARDLTECLLLQLEDDSEIDLLVRRLLLHFPQDLFASDSELARMAGSTEELIAQARLRMRRLDPFPGHGMRGDNNFYVHPEIIFRRTNSNEIEVEVPTSGWRGIRLNEQWQGHEWTGKDKEFMAEAMKEAKWLLQALDQRSETLMKVAICLAQRQRAFLEYGMLGLKPLTLQDVADEVGLHESTISRVTNGKYADTPVGLVELRRFFSAGLPTRGGGTISVYRVQQRVRALIGSEPPGKPISDQAIAERLQAEGIEIARRTVAKYREQLGLPPSSQRRRAASSR